MSDHSLCAALSRCVIPPLPQEMGNSPELRHKAIWRTAEATAADCLTCFTNQSSQFLLALVALLHSRAFSTHKALLPCTLLCALTAALPCLLPHSRARRAPALSRAFSTHKAVLPCTLFCALTAALTCQPHAQSSLALYAPLRPQLHSRARCTHRLSCLVRFLALAC